MCTQNTGNAGRKPKQKKMLKIQMLQRLNTKYTKELTLSELLIVNKSDLLTECDPRLKSFLKSATEKKKIQVKK